MKKAFVGVVGVLGLAVAANAQIWNEVGDAPARPHATGQPTIGAGALVNINGLGQFDTTGLIDADVYCVRVTGQFLASTENLATWDTMLALYDAAGTTQLFFNDDFTGLQSRITGNVAPGIYQLAITRFNDTGFDDLGGQGTSPYTIRLEGFEYCNIPAPGAGVLAGLAGLMALRRRR